MIITVLFIFKNGELLDIGNAKLSVKYFFRGNQRKSHQNKQLIGKKAKKIIKEKKKKAEKVLEP